MKAKQNHNPENKIVPPESEISQYPDVMTEAELIRYLRIPEVSPARDYHHVIENLIRMHDLPRMHLSNKCLYPKKAIQDWIEKQIVI